MPKPLHSLPSLSKNIRYYRKMSGLKLYELAEKVGMAVNHFGRIERGLNIPSAAVVQQIADILGIPIANLFMDRDSPGRAIIHFRGKGPITKDLKHKAGRIIELYSQLEDICGAHKYRSFPLDIPSKNFSNNDIEEAAQMVRELLGIRHAIVFDLFDLFESNGLRIIVLKLPENISGFSYCEPNSDTITFFINEQVTMERKIYTLAHELGHVIFHQGSFKYQKGNLDSASPGGEVEIDSEKVADYFAASFLMPRKSIQQTVQQMGIDKDDWSFDLIIRIKTRYGISSEAFLNRILELGLIKKPDYQRILEEIMAYYKTADHLEPGPERSTPNQNSRLWDLVLIGIGRKNKTKEINLIQEELISLGIVK